MSRLLFPDAASVDRVQATAGTPLLSASGAEARVYLDEAGTQLADILNGDGSPNPTSTLILDNSSRLPDFYGPPSGVDTLYVRVDGGSPVEVEAKLSARFDAQDAAVTAALEAQEEVASATYLSIDPGFGRTQGARHPEVVTVTASGAVVATSPQVDGVVEILLNADTTLSLTSDVGPGLKSEVLVAVTQDATGSREITFPPNVRWDRPGPVLERYPNQRALVRFISTDQGETWDGTVMGWDYAVPAMIDTFHRDDTATILGEAETGQVWEQSEGTWLRRSFAMLPAVATAGENICLVESGRTTGTIEAKVSLSPTPGRAGLGIVFNALDEDNCLLVIFGTQAVGAGFYLQLFKRVAGAYTELVATPPGVPPLYAGEDYDIRILRSATTVRVLVNGGDRFTHVLSGPDQAAFNSRTRVGLRSNTGPGGEDGGSRVRLLKVTP